MKKELTALRAEMKTQGVDVYIVPTGDFHGSEYIHDYFKTREYISGFTGSAGTLVVTQDEAALWTDGRYFLQAAAELQGSGIELMKDKEPGVPSIPEYLSKTLEMIASKKIKDAIPSHKVNLSDGPVLGFDGRTLPCNLGEEYESLVKEYGGSIASDFDLVGAVWDNRPVLEGKEIWELPLSSAGIPFERKITEVRKLMKDLGADYHLITTLDDNAWLFNLRGSDVERTPVFFSYTLITPKDVILYIFDDKCPREMLPSGVTIKPYFQGLDVLSVCMDMEELPDGARLLVDKKSVPYAMKNVVPSGVDFVDVDFIPSTRLKACKNPVEIECTKEAHINDGIAMVNFIHWLKSSALHSPEGMTEIGASDYLENQRKKLPGFIDLSFDTIAGYGPHGAIVHYSATPESDAALKPEGFLLVDSGGQYLTGTTDITRTIALGPLTDEMKEAYTAVLKGHIQLAIACFPKGTVGKELDPLAKGPLEAAGLSYNHGTGHGVGHVLCVHENPNRINTICEEPILPGMITSNEPGYYPEGKFGVRIENEILCVPCDDDLYCFENLTCCPYERDAIIKERLTPEEIHYVDDYHAWVVESLTGKVNPEAEDWLKEVCKPL